MKQFLSLVVNENENQFKCSVEPTQLVQLSEGNIVIDVAYSSVNYKDSLAGKQNGGVIRNYPMIPGIDLSGTILESTDKNYQKGDKVIVTSYDLGVSHTGGFSEIARVPSNWLVPLPKELSLKNAMVFGTAGFTAGLCIESLETHGLLNDKAAQIIVSGASGGVGTLAIAMLKQLSYTNITAISRKEDCINELLELGAKEVILLKDFLPDKIKPLTKQAFDFAIDTVGGDFIDALLPQMNYTGAIALCGNAAGINIQTTVLPFILRGINLLGIDSVNTEMNLRKKIWQRLATDLNVCDHAIVQEIDLQALPVVFTELQKGTHQGRTIVKMP